jgi:hypothetical protein
MYGIRNERGVAMTTVMFIGAALTALTSTAVFVTVQEFRAGSEDRKSASAVAYAEAGVDRFIQYLRGARLTYGSLRRAGCEDPALALPEGSVGSGTFNATLQVYNPAAASPADRLPQPPTGGACATRSATARAGQHFLITSEGEHLTSRRVVQQVIRVKTRGLPLGLVGNEINANGTPNISGISIVTSGTVVGRNKLDMTGSDSFYTLEDFWPGATWTGGLTGASRAPAAVHAVGGIFLGNNAPEFPPNPNCGANKTNTNTQSLWDSDGSPGSGTVSSGCSGQTGYPPTSKFTQADYDRVAPEELTAADHANLKRAAMESGLYCFKPSSETPYCMRQGTQVSYSCSAQACASPDVAPILAAGTNNFVAYFEFESGDPLQNTVTFNSSVWGCNEDPALNRSMVMLVDNGGVDLAANQQINGAIIVDGNFDYTGTPTINGTIIANSFRIRGTASFTMDACWVSNIPGAFLSYTPTQWSEVDR